MPLNFVKFVKEWSDVDGRGSFFRRPRSGGGLGRLENSWADSQTKDRSTNMTSY